MKELKARASAPVTASPEQCATLLRAVDRYPDWYPDGVRSVEVLECDDAGSPTRVRATLHLSQGPLQRDFALTLTVSTPAPGRIALVRESHGGADEEEFSVTWEVESRGDGAQVGLALDANLSVPRFLPVGGVGESVAQGFVGAAVRALA